VNERSSFPDDHVARHAAYILLARLIELGSTGND
jgi:hypothetical protein